MTEVCRWRFFICPMPHIRTTSNEKWLFSKSVEDEYLKKYGQKKYLERVAKGSKNPGTPNAYYNRKKTIKRYWDYKVSLKTLADLQNFEMPESGSWIRFYLPIPKSWSKKKQKEKCFTLVNSGADLDNILKGFLDSILTEDKAIADVRVSKFYYSGAGFIEVTLGELPVANGYTRIHRDDKIK